MMSRKHYVKVAAILAQSNLTRTERLPLAQEFVVMFREDNPNFDSQRFLTACGLT